MREQKRQPLHESINDALEKGLIAFRRLPYQGSIRHLSDDRLKEEAEELYKHLLQATPSQMKRLNGLIIELRRRGFKITDNDTGLPVYPDPGS